MSKPQKPLPTREDALRMLAAMAGGRANDCARLALEDDPPLEALDLTPLQEIRRGPGGSVEVKLADRLRAVELLLSLLEPDAAASDFFDGLEKAAELCRQSN